MSAKNASLSPSPQPSCCLTLAARATRVKARRQARKRPPSPLVRPAPSSPRSSARSPCCLASGTPLAEKNVHGLLGRTPAAT